MINCTNFNENICAYIDNELSIEERLSFEEHAKSCRVCKLELDEMTRIVGICTSLPQYELPEDFKSELHEKLVAVADRQDRLDGTEIKIKNIRKPKGFLFLKTFAAVAAGLLLVFLAGSYFKTGLFSPIKSQDTTNSISMAMEQPAAAKDEAVADANGGSSETGKVGTMQKKAETFGAPAAAQAGTAEVDRSAAVQNRDAASAEQASVSESANSKLSTITVITDDPNKQIDKIKLLAAENNSVIVDKSLKMTFSASMAAPDESIAPKASDMPADNAGSPAPLQLDLLVPDTQYDKFVAKLYAEFGAANVKPGALVAEDVTETLNTLIVESIELDNRIQELQKEDGTENASEIDELKVRKESADKRIDELRLGNDFVNVTVLINGK